jgi:hypothetical protein
LVGLWIKIGLGLRLVGLWIKIGLGLRLVGLWIKIGLKTFIDAVENYPDGRRKAEFERGT